MQVQQVIANLRAQSRVLRSAEDEINTALKLLEGMDVVSIKVKHKGKAKRKMSAAARKRIGDAARARWAEKRAKEGK